MAPTMIKAKDPLKNLEQQLTNELALAKTAPSWASIATQLERVRSYCAAALLRDIEQAKANGIDDERLWTAHRNVNDRFRAQYTHTPRSKPVERRKLDAEYLRYIKASQRFYRGYIYNLSIAYGGIRVLEQVAEKVEKGSSGEHVQAKHAPDAVRERVLRSCCTSLSQLGDLSRYRETQLPSKDKGPDWSHAIGYYELAQAVLPRSGLAQNQMAVVAIADNNNFRSVYHLYLSLLSVEPHPHAFNNLKKALYKIRSLRETGKLFQDNGSERSASHILRAWYLQVISNCFHGKSLAQQDQLEKEYLQHLDSFIVTGLKDLTLYKITLINIAAGHYARMLFEKDSESEDRMNSFLQFLRLNIKTLTVVLRAVEHELKQTKDFNFTANMRKLLPPLRLYSAWLLENGRIVAGATELNSLDIQRPLWEKYSNCLTLMASVFPTATQLPDVAHLLDEDQDTIGFAPLHNDGTDDIWLDDNHQLKQPRPQGLDRQSTADLDVQEHLTRVRYILRTGLHLAVQSEFVPIAFSSTDARFYSEATGTHSTSLYAKVDNMEMPNAATVRSHPMSGATAPTVPAAMIADEDLQAARMVDNLVSDDYETSFSLRVAAGDDSLAAMGKQTQMDDAPPGVISTTSPFPGFPYSSPSPSQLPSSTASLPLRSPPPESSTLPKNTLRSHPQYLTSCSPPSSGGHPRIHKSMHARANSNESTISRSSIWATEVPGSAKSPLGNGTFGLDHESTVDDSRVEDTVYASTGNLAWSAAAPTRQANNTWSTGAASPQWSHSSRTKQRVTQPMT